MNNATVNVSQYMIYINGNNEALNETTKLNKMYMFAAYTVCSCDSPHTVSISAVNTCGRAGQRIPDINVTDTTSLIVEMERECALITTSEASSRTEGTN